MIQKPSRSNAFPDRARAPAAGLPRRWAALLLALGGAVIPLQAQPLDDRMPDESCLDCHAQRTLVKTNADEQIVSLFTDTAVLRASAHATNWCVDCHADLQPTHPHDRIPARPAVCASCHQEYARTYRQSVHGRARAAGKLEAAACAQCHGGHEILATTNRQARLFGQQMLATCGACHQDQAAAVRAGVHGQAWEQDRPGAPHCASCHRAHTVRSLRHDAPLTQALVTCGQCHGQAQFNTAHNLPQRRVETYLDHYHGLAAQWGLPGVPTCADCHRHHEVRAAKDPRSPIHPANLAQTCARCHEGATANFAVGKVHLDPQASDAGSRANRWAARFYLGLIAAVTAVMLLHHGLWLATGRRSSLRAGAAPPKAGLSAVLRWQYLLLLMSLGLLLWTGFALRWPATPLGWTLGADEELRRGLHRGAAIALMVLLGAHLLHLRLTQDGRAFREAMRLSRQDWRTLGETCRRLAKFRLPPPATDLGYAEKVEYWSMVWGSVIMTVTGLLLWFNLTATYYLPRWALDVALTIHYFEAILAALGLLLWHGWLLWLRARTRVPPAPSSPNASAGPPRQSLGKA